MDLMKHQVEGFIKAQSALKKESTFRYNMFTGSGKTILAIYTADRMAKGSVVVACHTNLIKGQFQDEVNKHSDYAGRYFVDTYQSLRNSKRKCDFLIVDEVHQGGQTDDGSYNKIISKLKPRKIISLSATDSGVVGFGDNKFMYGLQRAMEDGLVNDCDLITIDSGFINELSDGRDIKAKGILSMKDKLEGVNTRGEHSKRSIERGAILSAIDVYREREGGKAIFFVPSIKMADWAYGRMTGISRAVSHSKIKDSEAVFNSFKSGDINVLICVRQGQEGFDFPELEVVFDCAPSFTNGGRIFGQRIGRILRKSPGKNKSRYYMVNNVNKYSSYLDVHDSMMANAQECVANNLAKKGKREIALLDGEVDGRLKVYSLFICQSSGWQCGSRSLGDVVYVIDPEGRKAELLRLAKLGITYSELGKKIKSSLLGYINNKYPHFDQVFKDEILGIRPDWATKKRYSIGNKERILVFIRENNRFPRRNEFSKSFINCLYVSINPNSQRFDQKFYNSIEDLNPTLLKGYKNRLLRAKGWRLIMWATNGGNKPTSRGNTCLYQQLWDYTSLKSRKYDGKITKKLKEIRPDWFID